VLDSCGRGHVSGCELEGILEPLLNQSHNAPSTTLPISVFSSLYPSFYFSVLHITHRFCVSYSIPRSSSSVTQICSRIHPTILPQHTANETVSNRERWGKPKDSRVYSLNPYHHPRRPTNLNIPFPFLYIG